MKALGRPGEKGVVIPLGRAAESIHALARLAMIDDVTGLNNRRFLLQYLDTTCIANAEPLSLAILDMDHFKAINDSYGHLCGDAVLASFAGFLRSRLRREDIAVRYAGDEFVLVFPEMSIEETVSAVDRLCSETADQIFAGDLPGRAVTITFSAGVAEFPADARNGRDLLRRADAALYMAKEEGRNRVCRSTDRVAHDALLVRGQGFRSPRIFGRESELGLLRAVLNRASEGRGQFAIVSGEAGVGKSRCVSHIQQLAAHDGYTVLSGGCYEHTASMPYWGLTDLLRDSLVSGGRLYMEDLAGHLPSLVHLLPELDSLAAGAPLLVKPLHPEERNLFFSGISRFLIRLSEDAPLLLRLDDLQWVDQSSAHFLQFFGRQIGSSRIAILGTYRPEEIRPPVAEHPLVQIKSAFSGEEWFHLLPLGRLGQSDVARMVCSIFGVEHIAEGFVDFLYRESEGNPFFVEHILQTLYEDGSVYRSPEGWSRDMTESISLPASIREHFQRRLGRLEDRTREALSQAAVIGETFDVDTLLEMTGLNEGFLLDILDEARLAFLIEECGESGDEYRFSHGKIRQVLYEEMAARRRKYVHRQLAEIIEGRGPSPDNAAELSRHFFHGDEPTKAWRYAWIAAENAGRLLAFHEALVHLRQASDLLTAGRVQVTPAERAEFHHVMGRTLLELGIYVEARTALSEACEEHLAHEDFNAAAQAESLLAMCDERCGEFISAHGHLERALNLLEGRIPEPATLSGIYRSLGAVCLAQGRLDQALPYAEQHLAIARQANLAYDERRAILLLGSLYFEWDRYAEAESYFQEGSRLSNGIGDSIEGRFLNNLGVLAFHRGQWPEAKEAYQKGIRLARRLGDAQLESIILTNLCEIHTAEGELDIADQTLHSCMDLAARLGSHEAIGFAHYHESMLAFRRSRYDEALTACDAALEPFRAMGSTKSIALAVLLKAAILAKAERLDEAGPVLETGTAYAREAGGSISAIGVLCGAFISFLRGDYAQSKTAAADSARRFSELECPYEEGLSLLLGASAARAHSGESPEGRTLLENARRIFKALGAALELAEADKLASVNANHQ